MKSVLKSLFAICALLLSTASFAQLRMPEVLGSNMVLQQATDVTIWGWAPAGSKVTVKPDWGKAVKVTAGEDGLFEAGVTTLAADLKPHSLKVSCGKEKVEYSNILFGEVWICGGQSNMGMPLVGYATNPIEGYMDEITAAQRGQLPVMRYAQVQPKASLTKMEDVERMSTGSDWQTSDGEQIKWWCAVPYFFAKELGATLNVPVGIIVSCMGATTIEAWMTEEDCRRYDDVTGYDYTDVDNQDGVGWCTRPFGMYNAMIPGITRYRAKGFLWYQGEGNTGNAATYASKMQTLVSRWRELWGDDTMPFYYAEITPLGVDGCDGLASAVLREQQFEAQGIIPHSAMVCTNDLLDPYEWNCWHPKRKNEIGKRMAWISLTDDYGKAGFNYRSPYYKGFEVNGSEVTVTFETFGYSIAFSGEPAGMELAGADGVFHPADSYTLAGSTVTVKSAEVAEPVAVRYAFRNYLPGTLISQTGLPVIPFRSDR